MIRELKDIHCKVIFYIWYFYSLINVVLLGVSNSQFFFAVNKKYHKKIDRKLS